MHYLNREIEKLNEELSWMECKRKIKSPLLTGMPVWDRGQRQDSRLCGANGGDQRADRPVP